MSQFTLFIFYLDNILNSILNEKNEERNKTVKSVLGKIEKKRF